MCEKLQVLLLSNKRQGSIESNRLSQNLDEQMQGEEKDSTDMPSTRLKLAHLSDTESESEILDSPVISKRSLFKDNSNQHEQLNEESTN